MDKQDDQAEGLQNETVEPLHILEARRLNERVSIAAIPTADGIKILSSQKDSYTPGVRRVKDIQSKIEEAKEKAPARKEWWLSFLIEDILPNALLLGLFIGGYALFGGFDPEPVESGTPATYEQIESHYGIDVLNTSMERSGNTFLYVDDSKPERERAQACNIPTLESMDAGKPLDCASYLDL